EWGEFAYTVTTGASEVSMRTLGRGFLLLLILIVPAAAVEPRAGDLRKSKAYLREVKKHLLESYIDSDRLKEEDLIVAGIKAMAAAVAGRAEVRDAILGSSSLEGALEAAEGIDADLDLIPLADHAARAMVAATGDPYSHLFTDDEMNRMARVLS